MRRLRSLKTGVYFLVLSFLLSCILPPTVLANPTVSITRPGDGAQVTGETVIDVTYKGETGLPVCSLQLFVDGKLAQQWNLPQPQIQGRQSLPWNFSLTTGQNHVISVRAVDAQGGIGNATITVRLQKAASNAADLLPPVVTIFYPAHGAKVYGNVPIKANVSDNDAVASVFFYVDGKFKCMIMNAPPYATDLDTTKLSDGPHLLSARALDQANNEGKSAEITIFVQNKSLTSVEADVPEPAATVIPQSAGPAALEPGAASAIPQVSVPPVISPPQMTYLSPAALAPVAQTQAAYVPVTESGATQSPVAVPVGQRAVGNDIRTSLPGTPTPSARNAGQKPSLAPAGTRLALIAPPSSPPAGPAGLMLAAGAAPAGGDLAGQTLAALPNDLVAVGWRARIGEPDGSTPGSVAMPPVASVGVLATPRTGATIAAAQTELGRQRFAASLNLGGARTGEPEQARPLGAALETGMAPTVGHGYAIAMAPKPDSRTRQAKVGQPPHDSEPVASATIHKIRIILDGKDLDLGSLPETRNGVSTAPLRELFERTDGQVYWYPVEQRVRAVGGEVELSVVIGEQQVTVNNETKPVALAPYIKEGHAMVPLQLFANAFKMKITFNPDSGEIVLSSSQL